MNVCKYTEYNDMMNEIEKQKNLKEAWKRIENQAEIFCEEIKIKGKDKKLFFTGCGDSYFAGSAVKNFYVKYTGITCLPMTSLEFSKYGINEVDESSTVIAISMSGNVARTLEAIEAAQKKKALVIGVTNSLKGELYKKADYSLYLGMEEEPGWTPGTLTYAGTLLALYAIAMGLISDTKISIAPETNIVAEGEEETNKEILSRKMEEILFRISSVIDSVRETAAFVGKNLIFNRHTMPFYVIGAGPSFATAKYSAAKFLEICDIVAIGQESEEFAHQEFWVLDKNNPVFIVAPEDESLKRTAEIAGCLREFGCDLYVISSNKELCELGKYSFYMEDIFGEFSPLIYDIPMQLIAYYYSLAKGLDPDRRSHNDPFRKKVSRLMTRGKVCEI